MRNELIVGSSEVRDADDRHRTARTQHKALYLLHWFLFAIEFCCQCFWDDEFETQQLFRLLRHHLGIDMFMCVSPCRHFEHGKCTPVSDKGIVRPIRSKVEQRQVSERKMVPRFSVKSL